MSKFATFIEGYDPTSDVLAITRSNLLKMVHEAEHVDYVGPVIHQIDAPNVALYPKLAYFIWHKLTTGPVGTGELYWWNSAAVDWLPLRISAGAISGSMIADGTITLDKLSASGLTPLAILRVNAAGDGFEAVSIDNILLASSIALSKLVNAASDGYVLFSDVGGIWVPVFWNAKFEESLSTAPIPVVHLTDLDGVGLQDQVLRRTSTGTYTHEYVDQILRANQVTTDRLKFGGGMAGKFVKVNALGTDLEGVSSTGGAASVLKYTGITNTPAQSIPATTETTVQWNSVVDPDTVVLSIVSEQFELGTGSYLLDIYVPIRHSPSNASVVLALYNVTGGNTVIATSSMVISGDADGQIMQLKHTIKVTATSNIYDVRIYSSVAITLGLPVNLSPYAETYQQMSIIKLA